MGKLVNIISNYHNSSKRNYLERMNKKKPKNILIAKKYGKEFWDGSRERGYGGYKYIPGKWTKIAKKLIKKYNLNNNSRLLDIGCGKAFLLHEIKLILPKIQIVGYDISKYAIQKSTNLIKPSLKVKSAESKYPFKNNYFDLAISISTLHNLKIFDLEKTLKEFERVCKNGYIVVESYRNVNELFNLQCWALTCEAFFSTVEWKYLFKKFSYKGDYEFIFFK
tara:strand:+ start:451 stop:1116 length:666 start_codon:yes stop_codon:yes gene_type:complete